MAGDCCGGGSERSRDEKWERVLLIALGINAGMFAVEMVAGVSAQSAALMADALDFLGDAANYLISLAVAGLALRWRSRAALLKGVTLLLVGLWVLASTAWMAYAGSLPQAETMGVVGVMALVANLWCAVILWRHREGDANRRSVWICSRNDAIGNLAVVAAAAAFSEPRPAGRISASPSFCRDWASAAVGRSSVTRFANSGPQPRPFPPSKNGPGRDHRSQLSRSPRRQRAGSIQRPANAPAFAR